MKELRKAIEKVEKILHESERSDEDFGVLTGKLMNVRVHNCSFPIGMILAIIDDFIKNAAERRKIRALKDFDLTDEKVQEVYAKINVSWNNRKH